VGEKPKKGRKEVNPLDGKKRQSDEPKARLDDETKYVKLELQNGRVLNTWGGHLPETKGVPPNKKKKRVRSGPEGGERWEQNDFHGLPSKKGQR